MACYLIKNDLIPVDEKDVPTKHVYPLSYTSGGYVVLYWKDRDDPEGKSKYFAIPYGRFMVMGFSHAAKRRATQMRSSLEAKVNI